MRQFNLMSTLTPLHASILSLICFAITAPYCAEAQVKKCTNAEGKVTYAQGNCPKATVKDQTTMQYTPVSEKANTAAANKQDERDREFRGKVGEINTNAKSTPKVIQQTSVTPLRDGSILIMTTKVKTSQ